MTRHPQLLFGGSKLLVHENGQSPFLSLWTSVTRPDYSSQNDSLIDANRLVLRVFHCWYEPIALQKYPPVQTWLTSYNNTSWNQVKPSLSPWPIFNTILSLLSGCFLATAIIPKISNPWSFLWQDCSKILSDHSLQLALSSQIITTSIFLIHLSAHISNSCVTWASWGSICFCTMVPSTKTKQKHQFQTTCCT